MKQSWQIFQDAVRRVLRAPGIALRLVMLPLALATLAHIVLSHGGDLLSVVIDAMAVALVAVGWHRYTLLGEDPGPLGVRWSWMRLGRYALQWVMLSLVAGVILLVPGMALWWLVGTLSDLVWMLVPDHADPDGAGYFGLGSGWAFWAVLALLAWPFLWLVFRFAMIMPYGALDRGELGLRQSFRLSASLEPAVAGCALFALLGSLLLMTPALLVNVYVLEPYLWGRGDSMGLLPTGYMLLETASLLVMALFGASVLSELYRRLPSEDAKA